MYKLIPFIGALCLLVSLCLQKVAAQQILEKSPVPTTAWLSSMEVDAVKVDSSISALVEQAAQDMGKGNTLDALQKIQWALLLEKTLPYPTISSFRLYSYAGELISPIHPEYGIQFFRKAIALHNTVEGDISWAVFSAYTNIAGNFQTLGQYDSAKVNFRKAIMKAHIDSPLAEVSSLNNIGVFFVGQAHYDSARWYFDLALNRVKTDKESISMYCAVRDNIAQMHVRDGKYHDALAVFEFNDSVYYNSIKLYYKFLPNKIRQLTMLQQLGMPGIKEEIAHTMQFIKQHGLNLKSNDILEFYQYAEEYFLNTERYPAMIVYRDLHRQLTDSISALTMDQLNSITKSVMAIQEVSFQHALTAQQLLTEKAHWKLQSSRRLLGISILAGCVIVTLLVLYFRKRKQEFHAQRLVAEAELRQRAAEARLIEKELALKKKDLTNLVLHNTHVHDANRKMIDRLQHVLRIKDQGAEQEIRSLLFELQSQDQLSEKAVVLQKHVDTVNEEFYGKLKTLFPALTKSESELCGYLRINLSNKDVSILKSIEVTSVKIGKNRLRKKLGLPAEANLARFLQEI